ncbi:enoyl-[acyl-carrier-protein] reductase [Mesobacillus boroniphilus JCM 21738]|uniref:Enoyl-[acyl-carrier-protein] reductase n=1 Tax=Mesobacillus boroniphilus JCM 21738 TaxID=1294265 RepID=W4RPR4_9BACI|nr:enoyl-[acyl-carrier-protein] reductase [Mesobacillus boroniphilus JCM 21738]
MPARAIANPLTEKILEIEKQGGGYEDLKTLISGSANRKYIYEGDDENGFGWAGQVMGLIKDSPTVAELFGRIINEAEEIRTKWGR